MAKKDERPVAPVVTSLPLPSSDSVLVIDLPDGQKLLVGKMSPGSVIEVATWRGTGRPDSRTNRLMLGMSNSELEQSSDPGTGENSEPVNKLSLVYALYVIRNIPAFTVRVYQLVSIKTKALLQKRNSKVTESKPEDDVQEWLNRITRTISSEHNPPTKSVVISPKTAQSAKKSPQKKKSSAKAPRKRT